MYWEVLLGSRADMVEVKWSNVEGIWQWVLFEMLTAFAESRKMGMIHGCFRGT